MATWLSREASEMKSNQLLLAVCIEWPGDRRSLPFPQISGGGVMRRRYSVKKCCVDHQGRLRWTPDEITEGPSNFKQRLQTVPVVAPDKPGNPEQRSGRIPPAPSPDRLTPRSTASPTWPRTQRRRARFCRQKRRGERLVREVVDFVKVQECAAVKVAKIGTPFSQKRGPNVDRNAVLGG